MDCNNGQLVYKERDIMILVRYNDVLKEHGKYASLMKKDDLYDEVARTFFITSKYAGRIIRRMLSDPKLSDANIDLVKKEFTEEVEKIEEIIRNFDKGVIGRKRPTAI